MTVEFLPFVMVFIATLVGALFVVGLFALGVRLQSLYDEGAGHRANRMKLGYYLCYGISGMMVVCGILLIVPPLHRFLGF